MGASKREYEEAIEAGMVECDGEAGIGYSEDVESYVAFINAEADPCQQSNGNCAVCSFKPECFSEIENEMNTFAYPHGEH